MAVNSYLLVFVQPVVQHIVQQAAHRVQDHPGGDAQHADDGQQHAQDGIAHRQILEAGVDIDHIDAQAQPEQHHHEAGAAEEEQRAVHAGQAQDAVEHAQAVLPDRALGLIQVADGDGHIDARAGRARGR